MRRLFLIALMMGFTTPALAIAPDGKGLFCIDQAIADETPDIDLVISAKFIAFWFDSGRALTTKWQRRNDEVILRSSPTGSSYETSSDKIDGFPLPIQQMEPARKSTALIVKPFWQREQTPSEHRNSPVRFYLGRSSIS